MTSPRITIEGSFDDPDKLLEAVEKLVEKVKHSHEGLSWGVEDDGVSVTAMRDAGRDSYVERIRQLEAEIENLETVRYFWTTVLDCKPEELKDEYEFLIDEKNQKMLKELSVPHTNEVRIKARAMMNECGTLAALCQGFIREVGRLQSKGDAE